MPFTIPDKWSERQTGIWDPDDTFDMYDNKGNLLANPDVYVPGTRSGGTGYNAVNDKGLRLVLKANNQSKPAPSFYNPWDLPGSTGGDDYRNNIANCNTNIVEIGHLMSPENGNMVGPTKDGTLDLIAKDPDAKWDDYCNCVKYSKFGKSPRIAIIPLYDPVFYATGKQNGNTATLKVANYLGFFIESLDANGQVIGRVTPVTGLITSSTASSVTAFPMAIRLVQ
jgi:hypothetical protein